MKQTPRHTLKASLITQFGGACQDCGYAKIPRALHFHHIDSSTKKDWSGSRGHASRAEIQVHPENFRLLCSNCHIETHDRLDSERARSLICVQCQQEFRRPTGTRPNMRFCSKSCVQSHRALTAQRPEVIRARMQRHLHDEDGHAIWTGHTTGGIPVTLMMNPDGTHQPRSVRQVLWNLDGKPPTRFLGVSCGLPLCLTHLTSATKKGGGGRAASTKLTEAQAIEILRSYAAHEASQAVLAVDNAVSQTAVSELVRGRTWPHLKRS